MAEICRVEEGRSLDEVALSELLRGVDNLRIPRVSDSLIEHGAASLAAWLVRGDPVAAVAVM